jgi:hypothetical protein
VQSLHRASHLWRPAIALTVVVGCAILGCGGERPTGTAPSPVRPPERPTNPPIYSAQLPDGGVVTLRLVEFQPPRGATLQVGEGAYVRAEVSVPDQKLMITLVVDGWSGSSPIGTSFLGGSAQFMCPPGRSPKQFLIGHDHSSRTPYPQATDPDVPLLRVRLGVTPYDPACSPPNIIPGDATPPLIVAIERVDWKHPQ